MSTPLVGCGTALATPFTSHGAIDERALRGFVGWQIDEGIDFLVPCGSTGEGATMTSAEHRRVVEITVDVAKGRVPVVAGAGSNDTTKAIEMENGIYSAVNSLINMARPASPVSCSGRSAAPARAPTSKW